MFSRKTLPKIIGAMLCLVVLLVGISRPGRLVRDGVLRIFRYEFLKISDLRRRFTGSETDAEASALQNRFDVTKLTSENARLSALIGLKEALGVPLVGARVIQYGRDFGKESLLIDRGAGQGEHTGDGVVDSNGFFVGTVSDVRADTSVVECASNPGTSFEAEILPIHVKGVAKGNGGGSMMLAFVPQTAAVKTGDLVSLRRGSGLVLLGEVAMVEPASDGIFQTIELRVASRPNTLSEVGIIPQR